MSLRVLDLFSGIGGFSLGLERTGGFETVAFCEIEPFPRKVLAKHWPGVPIYEDVTTIEHFGPVDLVAAGFPCQDISFAGQGAGISGARSGLFWYIIRCVCMVGQPKLLLENVAALLNRGLGSVLGALAEIGYDAEWHCIPASAVGAPHRRDRIWIVADARGQQHEGDRTPISGKIAAQFSQKNSDAEGERWDETGQFRHKQSPQWSASLRQENPCHRSQWAIEPDVGRVAHGVPDRVDRLAGLGNAVVPQIPELIGRAILEAEKQT